MHVSREDFNPNGFMLTYSTTAFCSSAGNLRKLGVGVSSFDSSISGLWSCASAACMLDCLRVSGGILSGEVCI